MKRRRGGDLEGGGKEEEKEEEEEDVVVCWLLNVPATCSCISGTDLLRQFYVLPH